MYRPPDMAVWHGRRDEGEDPVAQRWYQVIEPWQETEGAEIGITLLGFACDEGVRRNEGRVGARGGPAVLRAALANLACAREHRLYDAGEILCMGEDLECAQMELAAFLPRILNRGDIAIILGGGHEMALGSFLGLAQSRGTHEHPARIGIINLDAHFDLRTPVPAGNSGSAFRQIAEWCGEHGRSFHYMVLGINPAANTRSLFQYAVEHDVRWFTDLECTADRLPMIERSLVSYIAPLDELYLTLCLDVLPASYAPGVSAPAMPGIDPRVAIDLIQTIKALSIQLGVALRVFDIAELNPDFDLDHRTAHLAARLIHEFVT